MDIDTFLNDQPDGRVVPLGSTVTLKGPGIDGSAIGGQSVDSAQVHPKP